MIEVGKNAPEFCLPNADGNEICLRDLGGKWVVIYFYPKDDTPGCTTEACEFTSELDGFTSLNAMVIGISADAPAKHAKFIEKLSLKVMLLSDESKKTMEAYGAYGEKMMYGKKVTGVIRSTVIIAPDGKVAKHYKSVKAKGHAEKVKADLTVLQKV